MKTSLGHLTYCTNIHAGENWKDHFAAFRGCFPYIKRQVSPSKPLGLGLRLSGIASLELSRQTELSAFKNWLAENDAYVFTMNGFPYGGFHHTRVKDNVHAPDWTTIERLDYTKRLFDILVELVPADLDGGVSTSPLSYWHWFPAAEAFEAATTAATQNIIEVVAHLVGLHQLTGKLLHLDIEPEPDGILETGAEFIHWYNNRLLPLAKLELYNRFSMQQDEAELAVKAHVRLCYDVCHFAIGYERHEQVLRELKLNAIRVGKIQVSAAVKALMPVDTVYREKVKEAFSRFNESTYLHQVIALNTDGTLLRYPDLPEALDDVFNPGIKEWRAHFHVPVFEKDFGTLQSTREDIIEVLQLQEQQLFTSHLEVETYTWEVIPAHLRLPLEQSIARELEWVSQLIAGREV